MNYDLAIYQNGDKTLPIPQVGDMLIVVEVSPNVAGWGGNCTVVTLRRMADGNQAKDEQRETS